MKKLWFGILSLIFLFMCNISMADVLEKYNATDISIKNYVLVNSWYDGNKLNRSFELEIQNTGETILFDVKAILIHISSSATIAESVVDFGSVVPGDVITGYGTFESAVDTSQMTVGKIIYTWQIEYVDLDGNDIIDEIIVEENLN